MSISLLSLLRYSATGNLTITTTSSVAMGLYINLISDHLKQKTLIESILAIGSWNVLLMAYVLFFLLQIAYNRRPVKIFEKEKKQLIEKILETAALSLVYPFPYKHIRAIVTLTTKGGKLRKTTYSYNIVADPERAATFPALFGVTGKAFRGRRVIIEELPNTHLATYKGNVKNNILPEICTVLAAPIFSVDDKEAPPLGILAFDSTLPIKDIGFDNPVICELAQKWADILATILVDNEKCTS